MNKIVNWKQDFLQPAVKIPTHQVRDTPGPGFSPGIGPPVFEEAESAVRTESSIFVLPPQTESQCIFFSECVIVLSIGHTS